MRPSELLDNPLSNDMIGQTAKGLGADDVGRSRLNKLQHLSGKKPPFSCLISKGDITLGHLGQVFNGSRRLEIPALCQGLSGIPAKALQHLDDNVSKACRAG